MAASTFTQHINCSCSAEDRQSTYCPAKALRLIRADDRGQAVAAIAPDDRTRRILMNRRRMFLQGLYADDTSADPSDRIPPTWKPLSPKEKQTDTPYGYGQDVDNGGFGIDGG